jgi:SAM-dependent methyltransferase
VIFVLGPIFAEGDKETAVPALVSEASGVVLEIGPGIGSQLPRYNISKITKVYGVEPNIDLHESLREKVKASGLTDVYEIAPCGIEDVVELEKHGIALGSIDTVLSIQVLCSVPDPDEMLRRLYALMKPGGQLVVYEHVKSRDVVSVMVQSMFVPSLIVPFR